MAAREAYSRRGMRGHVWPRRRKFVGPIVSRVTWHGGRGRQRSRWALIIRSSGLSEKPGESEEKGPAARRRPMAAREAHSLYVERAGAGANEADGPLLSP